MFTVTAGANLRSSASRFIINSANDAARTTAAAATAAHTACVARACAIGWDQVHPTRSS